MCVRMGCQGCGPELPEVVDRCDCSLIVPEGWKADGVQAKHTRSMTTSMDAITILSYQVGISSHTMFGLHADVTDES